MLRFTKVTVKNFLSYGNFPTELVLDKDSTTLVVGKNGQGKSSILLDGICFCLFNKPYRKISKTQLVNSFNKKDCTVELELTVNKIPYKIVRGIKPNVFEIWKEGVLLDQNVISKDLQDHLESDILGLNFKTFGQTVILGSAGFIAFMSLDAAKRREVVDDVLGVGIYTDMAVIHKEIRKSTLEKLKKAQDDLENLKREAAQQKKIVDILEQNQADQVKDLQDKLDVCIGVEADHQKSLPMLEENLKKLKERAPTKEDANPVKAKIMSLESEIRRLQKSAQSISSLHSCPSCLQGVSADHKEAIEKETIAEIAGINGQLNALNLEAGAIDQSLVRYNEWVELYNTNLEGYNSFLRSLREIQDEIKGYEADIAKAKKSTGNIKEEKLTLKAIAQRGRDMIKVVQELQELVAIHAAAAPLLTDAGIKAQAIKEYLPVFNQLINRYLQVYNFNVDFSLDENFDETVKSRGHDTFTYHSFSEGEKEKIDYSIMIALRSMAAMRNSANINLLVLDEIMDGSLDTDSRVALLTLLCQDVENANIFVISHTESNPGFYDSIIEVAKKGDFSQMSYLI